MDSFEHWWITHHMHRSWALNLGCARSRRVHLLGIIEAEMIWKLVRRLLEFEKSSQKRSDTNSKNVFVLFTESVTTSVGLRSHPSKSIPHTTIERNSTNAIVILAEMDITSFASAFEPNVHPSSNADPEKLPLHFKASTKCPRTLRELEYSRQFSDECSSIVLTRFQSTFDLNRGATQRRYKRIPFSTVYENLVRHIQNQGPNLQFCCTADNSSFSHFCRIIWNWS